MEAKDFLSFLKQIRHTGYEVKKRKRNTKQQIKYLAKIRSSLNRDTDLMHRV